MEFLLTLQRDNLLGCSGGASGKGQGSKKAIFLKELIRWAIPPVRLGLSGRNSGKIPERPRKRSESVSWNFPREYGWDAPSPMIQGI